jgi:FkbM family methyltransferase
MLNRHPVLVDVGASGNAPRVWQPIARHSMYLGFDPDQREPHETSGGAFHKSIVLNKAITERADAKEVHFYFTKQPHCSSTLRPDAQSLSEYLFADLFAVQRESTVSGETLNSVIDRLGLQRIDWLKIDTQGTDLRIWDSLSQELRSHPLALDIEPGLAAAYEGEDMFVDAHRQLTSNGFWLSNLNVRGAVRMRKKSLDAVLQAGSGLTAPFLEAAAKKSPMWCEARYLRTIDSLVATHATKSDFVMLWIFAMLDDQAGFALDVVLQTEESFGNDEMTILMRAASITQLGCGKVRTLVPRIKNLLPTPVKLWIKAAIGR